MKTLFLQLAALPLLAQTNAIQLCDQQTPKHCLTLKAPSLLTLSPSPVLLSGQSGALLVGLATTELSVLAGSIVSADAFVSVSAATDASVMSMAATPSSGGADISVSKTGGGALLPLRFFRNPNEVARFDTSNRFLIGATADDGSGSLFQVAGKVSASTGYRANGNLGGTAVLTIRNSAGTGTCTITFSGGLFIASTC